MASAVSLLLVADNFRPARTYTIYLDFRQKFSAWLLPFNIYGVNLVQSLAYIFHDTFQELDTISEDGLKTFHVCWVRKIMREADCHSGAMIMRIRCRRFKANARWHHFAIILLPLCWWFFNPRFWKETNRALFLSLLYLSSCVPLCVLFWISLWLMVSNYFSGFLFSLSIFTFSTLFLCKRKTSPLARQKVHNVE